ncbi:MAG: uroporphyrinogen-III synthase, partial [Thermoanaerobaculales bacterium]|nr:uroporphyrinogen-III synthase [Thermoanaerobaculales bacterium]
MSGFVLITRHPAECGELQSALDPCGLKLRPYPVLRLTDVHDDDGWDRVMNRPADLLKDAWLVMASPRAPERFAAECRRRGADSLLELPVAAVGTGTAASARSAGFRVELVGPGTGAGLAEQLVDHVNEPTTFVFACGRDRRPELPRALAEAGQRVLPVVVYRMDPTPPRELPPLGPSLEAVVLTSPRAARLYL